MSTGSSGAVSARILVAVVAAAGILPAGCGSNDSGKSAPDRPAASAAYGSAAPTTDTPRAATTIRVDDMAFSPASVTIATGETVTWQFSDKVPHGVQGIGDSAMGVDSPILTEGEWSHTFPTPGTYRYLCPLHPSMRGTITVR
ncbi:plastocyanin/azurin family copper-binding protein [Nocardia sp. BMG51109]|uniref:plastocyanin/azurin family copper-binding protein n=1 Tax=Nocardia sp. BMG51109 TaxID=1056816 RepID=UPI000563C0CB|nr:plastocyanin/azurin family copper-binding protein [Nocardia sp. BMG51109]